VPLPWVGAAKRSDRSESEARNISPEGRRNRIRRSLERARRTTPVWQPPTHLSAVRRVIVTEEAHQGSERQKRQRLVILSLVRLAEKFLDRGRDLGGVR